jgi:hypothetical protein
LRILSGAGEFEVRITKVVNEDGDIVMLGRMGLWEARLVLTTKEALVLAKSIAVPVLRAVLKV